MTKAKHHEGRAIVEREYGPFGEGAVHGVAHDGKNVWMAVGGELRAIDPASGTVVRALAVPSDAGTTFDGTHLYQLTGAVIQKVDPQTGEVVGTIPAPAQGCDSGLAWAEGKLWVGQYRERKIHCIDPQTGRIERTIESDRFVTGVTFTGDALWHATWEGDEADLRRIDRETGEVLERHALDPGIGVTGLASDGVRFYCGGGAEGKLRAVRAGD
jgi:glutamine cyclotransferase